MSSGVRSFYQHYSARTDASSVVRYFLASVIFCYTLFGILSWCNDGSTRISKNGLYLSPTTGTEKTFVKSYESIQQVGPENAPNCSRFVNTRKYEVDCMGIPTKLYKILITGLGGSGTHEVAEAAEKAGLQLPHEKLGYDGSVSWFYAVNDVLVQSNYPHRGRMRERSLLNPRFQSILHLVRCPMDQISSFTSHLNASYDFVRVTMLEQIKHQYDLSRTSTAEYGHEPLRHINEFPERSLWSKRNHSEFFSIRQTQIINSGKGSKRGDKCWLYFSALSWLFWNSHIQRYSDAFYRVETDIDVLIKDAVSVVGEEVIKSRVKGMWNYLRGRVRVPLPSVHHKTHGSYGLHDIFLMDPGLALEIVILANYLGYDLSKGVRNLPKEIISASVHVEGMFYDLSTPPFRQQYVCP